VSEGARRQVLILRSPVAHRRSPGSPAKAAVGDYRICVAKISPGPWILASTSIILHGWNLGKNGSLGEIPPRQDSFLQLELFCTLLISYTSLRKTMSQWLERIERHVSLQRIQIASVAILASVATTGVIFGSFALRRRIATEDLKASIPTLGEKHHAENVCHGHAA
jgi:hypothetical protein